MEQTSMCDREIEGRIEIGKEVLQILSQGEMKTDDVDRQLLFTLGDAVKEIYRKEQIKGLAVGTY